MRKSVLMTALIAGLLILSAGCERRPLYTMEERVELRVTLDLDTVSNVMRNIYNDKIAKPNTNTDMMRVFLYDHESHELLTQGFLSDKSYDAQGHQVLSGYMNVNYGTYDFLIYNFDTPNTLIRDEGNEDRVEAYTSPLPQSVISSIAPQTLEGLISYQPDHLMVAREQNFYVAPHIEVPVIETTAYTCLNTYYIQIHVLGLQYVAGCTAVLSGLYSANKFGSDPDMSAGVGHRIGDPSTSVYFNLEKSTDDNIAGENKDVLCAHFNTFGKIENVASDLYVTFNAVDTQGNRIKKTISLDRLFKTADALDRHWLLIEDVWEIPDPNPNPIDGGGFNPVVDDWDDKKVNIDL